MKPILVDLSLWKPLGISLDSFASRAAIFAAALILAYAAAMVLSWRRSKLHGKTWPRRFFDIPSLLAALVLIAAVVGFFWAVGKVHSYGVMLAIGLLVAATVLSRLARRDVLPDGAISSLSLVMLIAGILGARLAFVIEHWHEMAGAASGAGSSSAARLLPFLLDAASIASGGLVFDGGLVVGMIAVLAYLRWRRLPIRRFLDLIAIAAMIGLGFGRIGCFLNGCCYGRPCPNNWPLAVTYPYAARPLVYPHINENPYPVGTPISIVYREQAQRGEGVTIPPRLQDVSLNGPSILKTPGQLQTSVEFAAAQAARSAPVYPAQLYAVVNDWLLSLALWLVWRSHRRPGLTFAWMLVLYPVTRFGLEFIRHDNPDMLLTPAQYKCLALLAAGLVLLAVLPRIRAGQAAGAAAPVGSLSRPAGCRDGGGEYSVPDNRPSGAPGDRA